MAIRQGCGNEELLRDLYRRVPAQNKLIGDLFTSTGITAIPYKQSDSVFQRRLFRSAEASEAWMPVLRKPHHMGKIS